MRIESFAILLAVSGLLYGQPARSPFGSVSGIVINDATGAPIRRAVITLSTLDATPLEAVTFSESNGTFGFHSIPPGKYQLRAEMDGFQQSWFGASTSTRPPGTLQLSAGDVRFGITFRLRPMGSISGTVFDSDGDPLPSAQVRLLKAGWDRLKPTYTGVGWGSSDDRGQYRFPEVLPGQYIVMASQPYGIALVMQPEAAAGQSQKDRMYASQFYPDAAHLSAAAPVQLNPGKDLEGIDFRMVARSVAALHVKLAAPPDLPANASVVVGIFPQDVPDGQMQSIGIGLSAPAWEADVSNLIPGPYVLTANVSNAARDYHAVEQIELPAGGQEVRLQLEPAIDLSGRVGLEGGAGAAGSFKVSLIPAGSPPGRQQKQTETRTDGSFTIPGVGPGIWDINVEPLPPGGYIKSMRLGDVDVLTQDMMIDATTAAELRIVLSTRAATVDGTVTVPAGVARTARASVLLAPSGKYANVLSFYVLGASDDAGHFELKGVTPGRYKLYAFEELDPTAYGNPGFLPPFEQLCDAFDVPEGGHLTRQIPLILAGGGAGK